MKAVPLCTGLLGPPPAALADRGRALGPAAATAGKDPRRGSAAYRATASVFERQGRAQQALSARQAAERLAQPAAR